MSRTSKGSPQGLSSAVFVSLWSCGQLRKSGQPPKKKARARYLTSKAAAHFAFFFVGAWLSLVVKVRIFDVLAFSRFSVKVYAPYGLPFFCFTNARFPPDVRSLPRVSI